MVVLRKCMIIISVCIISITNAETNGSKTVCGGSNANFFCGIIETIKLHIIIIEHNSIEIGRYSTDTGVEVYQEFKDQYLIVKNMFDIQIHISNVNEEDNGTISCTVIYETKEVKYEWSLIIQERLTSSVMDFKIKIGDPCRVLTCSANSNQLVLKKPDNESIIGKDIVLDSCNHYLPTGEFSCCLMTNCSEAECNKIMLEDSEINAADSANNYWMILFFIVTVVAIVAITFIFVSKTRLYKKKKKRLTALLHQKFRRQQNRSDHNQKNDKSTSGESKKFEDTENSDISVIIIVESKNSENSEDNDTGSSKETKTSQFSDSESSTESKTLKLSGSVRSDEFKLLKSSQNSECSDNLGIISENEDYKPEISV